MSQDFGYNKGKKNTSLTSCDLNDLDKMVMDRIDSSIGERSNLSEVDVYILVKRTYVIAVSTNREKLEIINYHDFDNSCSILKRELI